MNSIFAALVCMILAVPALASTVKVSSSNGTRESRGSGWLVELASGSYVVTSEHVLLAAGGQISISVNGLDIPCRILRSDWGQGLAVLKPLRDLPRGTGTAIDLQNTVSRALSPGDRVNVIGFPFAQRGEPLQSTGEISIVRSTRPFLAFAEGTEIIKSHGEFGMSGGAVFLDGFRDAGGFVGLLSHQTLTVVGAKSSVIERIKPGAVASNLFLISRETVFEALKKAVAGESSDELVRLSENSEPTALQSGGFTFRERPRATVTPIDAKGGDGIGIGGNDAKEEDAIAMEIGLKTDLRGLIRSEVAASWKKTLLQRKTLVVTHFVRRDSTGLHRTLFFSAEEFARFLKQPDLTPVTFVDGEQAAASESERWLQTLRANVLKAVELFQTAGLSEDALIIQLRIQMDLLRDENRMLIRPRDFRTLLKGDGPMAVSWGALYAADFDTSVQLMRDLREIEDLLKDQR